MPSDMGEIPETPFVVRDLVLKIDSRERSCDCALITLTPIKKITVKKAFEKCSIYLNYEIRNNFV